MSISENLPREAVTSQKPKEEHGAVTIRVNEKPVTVNKHRVTGLEIKESAISQGVDIEVDFSLFEDEPGREGLAIGDDDIVTVTKKSRFHANAGDDNS